MSMMKNVNVRTNPILPNNYGYLPPPMPQYNNGGNNQFLVEFTDPEFLKMRRSVALASLKNTLLGLKANNKNYKKSCKCVSVKLSKEQTKHVKLEEKLRKKEIILQLKLSIKSLKQQLLA